MRRSLLLLAAVLASGCARPHPPAPPPPSKVELCAQKLVDKGPNSTLDPCAHGCAETPQDARGWLEAGRGFLRDGALDEAGAAFIRAVRGDGRLTQGFNDLGIVALRQGRYADAECLLLRALELDPGYANARYNLALDYVGAGQPEKAQKELSLLASFHADMADLWLLLGVVQLQRDAPDDAVVMLKKALELDPRKARYWNGIAVVYAQQRRFEDAEYALRSCLEIDPRDVACQQGLDLARARVPLPQPELLAKP